MRGFLTLSCAVAFAGTGFSQTPGLRPSTAQFVTVESGVSASGVSPGGTVTLWVDVTPKSNIHVYAPGAKEFTAVAIVMTPRSGIAMGKPVYPRSELAPTAGVSAPVPMYRRMFRVAQPITVGTSAKTGETITLAGAVNYQACDDKICYPPASIPALWSFTVK